MKRGKIALAVLFFILLSSKTIATTTCGQTVTTAGLTTIAVTAPQSQGFTESTPTPTVTDVSGTLTTLADFTTGSAPAPACTSTGEDIIIVEQRDDTEQIEGTIRTDDYLAVITTDPVAGPGSPRDKIQIRCKDPDDFSTIINDIQIDLSPVTTIVNPKIATAGKTGTNSIALVTHLANGNTLTASYDCDTDTLDQMRNGGFNFLDSSDSIVTNTNGIYIAVREGAGGNLIAIKFDAGLTTVQAAQSYDLPQSITAPQIIETAGVNEIIVGAFRTTASDLLLAGFDSSLNYLSSVQINPSVTANPPEELAYDSTTEILVVRDSETITAVDTSTGLSTGDTLNSFETSTDGGVFADVYIENSKALTGGLTLNFLGAIGDWDLQIGTGLILDYWREDPDNQIFKVIKDANGNPWALGFALSDQTNTAISKYNTDGTGISYTTSQMDFDYYETTRELDRDNTGIYAGYTYRDSGDFDPTNTYAVKIDAPLTPLSVPEFSDFALLLAALIGLGAIFTTRKKL